MSTVGESAAHQASSPMYRRIKKHILEHILAGDWSAGDRIPSEHELKDQFRVSRMTVHRALRELVDEGYVSRVVGAGTYVMDRRVAAATMAVHDLCEEARRSGRRCRTKLLALSHGTVWPEIAARLGVASGSSVSHVVIVRWVDNWPVQLEERWVASARAPSFLTQDLTDETPAAVLGRLLPAISFDFEVRAVMPRRRIRTILALGAEEPALLVTETATLDGEIVSVADLHHPASRYALPGRFL